MADLYQTRAQKAEQDAREQRSLADKAEAEAHWLSVMESRSGRFVVNALRKAIRAKRSKGVTPVDARAHYERCATDMLDEIDGQLESVPAALVQAMREENE